MGSRCAAVAVPGAQAAASRHSLPTTTLGAAWHSPGSRRPASRVLLNVCQLPRHICWPKLTGATTPCGTAGTSVFLGGEQCGLTGSPAHCSEFVGVSRGLECAILVGLMRYSPSASRKPQARGFKPLPAA